MCQQIDAKTIVWTILAHKPRLKIDELPGLLRTLQARACELPKGTYLQSDGATIRAVIYSNPILFPHRKGWVRRGPPELFTPELVEAVVNARVPERARRPWMDMVRAL